MKGETNMTEKQEEILETYRQMVSKVHQALKLTDMPDNMIIAEIINLPDLTMLIPEDVMRFYKEVRTTVILHFHNMGFSRREITRRLGGSSYAIVQQTIESYEKGRQPKLATQEEVEKT